MEGEQTADEVNTRPTGGGCPAYGRNTEGGHIRSTAWQNKLLCTWRMRSIEPRRTRRCADLPPSLLVISSSCLLGRRQSDVCPRPFACC